MDKDMIAVYVWCIKHIEGYTIDNVPEQRREAVQEQIDNEGVD